MNFEQALEVLNESVFARFGRHLTDVETAILSGAWQSQTYEQIAFTSGYSTSYITRDVGPKVWKLLGQVLGENVSKTNFQTALERHWKSHNQADNRLDALNEDFLEIPSGIVPLDSPFYIKRPPLEERAYAQISTGRLIRIKAPGQMGKTSLMHRILAHGRQIGLRTVLLSLQQTDSSIFTSLDNLSSG